MDALRCARRSAVPLLIAAAVALPCGAAYADEGMQASAGGTAAQAQAVQAAAPADPLGQEPAEGAGSALDAGDKASAAGADGASAADGQEPADSAADASASGSQGEGPSEPSQASPSTGSDAPDDSPQPAKAASVASASVASASPASAQAASQAKAASAQRGWVESSGQVRYYDADGSAHTGWLVDSTYRSYGLQRYWFGSDGVLAKSRLVTKAEAGWWAYARPEGYVVRGRYADPSTGYVYLANNDGRLEGAGWVVSDSYGQGLQRYWVDSAAHAAKPGYSADGWAHYTRPEGYVVRGSYAKSGLVYLADNDGRLAKSGWVVSSAYGQGLQRYWVDAAKHAAVVGRSSDGWDHFTTAWGYVARNVTKDKDGSYYLADNDGRLVSGGWVVSSAYGQGLQRYYVDPKNAKLKVGFFKVDNKWYYGTSKGYELRGKQRVGDGMLLADNDGLLVENIAKEGWLVTSLYDGELQRYRIDKSCSGHLGAHLGYFTLSGNSYYGRYDQGYVVRNVVYTAPDGKMYYGDNDGVLGPLPARFSDMRSKAQSVWSSTGWLILVDRNSNRMAIYSGSRGNWTPTTEVYCVTGAWSTPTITGQYETTGYHMTNLTTDSRARWATQIYGGYFFHSILASNSELGNNLSHGCVRLKGVYLLDA